MRILYYVGTEYCGACGFVKKMALRLQGEYPDQVKIVDTRPGHYTGDLARIDKRKIIDSVPVCVFEEDGEEVARIVGHVDYGRLKRLLLNQ